MIVVETTADGFDLQYALFVWRRGWEDTCTASGMSREQATEWIDRHYEALVSMARSTAKDKVERNQR